MTKPALLFGFALLALSAPAQAGQRRSVEDSEHVTRTVKLDPGGTLRLKNFSGHVVITGSDRSDVLIDATRRAPRERLDRVHLDISGGGSTVVIEANERERSWFDWGGQHNVVETDFEIKVPRRTNLDVSVFSSPVDVRDVEGSHKIHGFSSRVRLEDIVGSVQAHTFSGGVEIRQKAWRNNPTIDVDTFSGSVNLYMPESARASVSFNSFSGRLTSDVPMTLHSSSRRSLKASLGGDEGRGRLRIKTFSGNARIGR